MVPTHRLLLRVQVQRLVIAAFGLPLLDGFLRHALAAQVQALRPISKRDSVARTGRIFRDCVVIYDVLNCDRQASVIYSALDMKL